MVSRGTSVVRIRFGSSFSSKVVVCVDGHCLVPLSLTINKTPSIAQRLETVTPGQKTKILCRETHLSLHTHIFDRIVETIVKHTHTHSFTIALQILIYTVRDRQRERQRQ